MCCPRQGHQARPPRRLLEDETDYVILHYSIMNYDMVEHTMIYLYSFWYNIRQSEDDTLICTTRRSARPTAFANSSLFKRRPLGLLPGKPWPLGSAAWAVGLHENAHRDTPFRRARGRHPSFLRISGGPPQRPRSSRRARAGAERKFRGPGDSYRIVICYIALYCIASHRIAPYWIGSYHIVSYCISWFPGASAKHCTPNA